MENKEKLLIIISIFIYIDIIRSTIQFYLFPNPDLNIIFQGIRQQTILIEFLFILIMLIMIPSFIYIRKRFEEEKLKKIPIGLIIAFSVSAPLFSLANTYLTGNLLFSTALIIYGIIFALLAFKYR